MWWADSAVLGDPVMWVSCGRRSALMWFDALERPRFWPVAREAVAESALVDRNPSSLHASGRSARRRLEHLAELLVERCGAAMRDVDVILTGGGAEALAVASAGTDYTLAPASSARARALLPAPAWIPLLRRGELWTWFDDRDGILVPKTAGERDRTLAPSPVDPRREPRPAGNSAKSGFRVADATAALGRCEISMLGCGADVVALGAELCGGPPGIGAVIRKRGVFLPKLWGGGGQEHGVRSGTQPVSLAAGWAAALGVPDRRAHLRDASNGLAQALDTVGLDVLNPAPVADGIVVAWASSRGARDAFVSALQDRGIFPARVDRAAAGVRFALDAGDEDGDIEAIVRAIRAL